MHPNEKSMQNWSLPNVATKDHVPFKFTSLNVLCYVHDAYMSESSFFKTHALEDLEEIEMRQDRVR